MNKSNNTTLNRASLDAHQRKIRKTTQPYATSPNKPQTSLKL